ncbi:MAG: uroporphyrinogen decarboxylase, partial [Planctomycetota bacterium]
MLKDSLAPDTTGVYSDKISIEKIETELYYIPLVRPMVDAIHGVQREFSLIVVKIYADNGAVGMGYTYTVGKVGGTAIATLIRDNLVPVLIGDDPRCIENIWQKMWWALHYVGRGGIAVFGMSAIDVALWDLKARMVDEPLWRLLGGHNDKVEAYGGGIDFDLTIEDLLLQTQGFLDAGLRAIKIKIGRDNIEEDAKRIAAVRDYIGSDL